MPDWVSNRLELVGPASEIMRFHRQIRLVSYDHRFDDEELQDVDIQCNELHEHIISKSVLDKLEREYKEPHISFLSSFVPEPDELIQCKDKSRNEKINRWMLDNWGTNRDALEVRIIDPGVYWFNTAWDEPMPWLIQVSRMFPDIMFVLSYTVGEWPIFCTATVQRGCIKKIERPADEEIEKIKKEITEKGKLYPAYSKMYPDDTPLERLPGLDDKTITLLQDGGIFSVEELVDKSLKELLAIDGIDEKTAQRIKGLIDKYVVFGDDYRDAKDEPAA